MQYKLCWLHRCITAGYVTWPELRALVMPLGIDMRMGLHGMNTKDRSWDTGNIVSKFGTSKMETNKYFFGSLPVVIRSTWTLTVVAFLKSPMKSG